MYLLYLIVLVLVKWKLGLADEGVLGCLGGISVWFYDGIRD